MSPETPSKNLLPALIIFSSGLLWAAYEFFFRGDFTWPGMLLIGGGIMTAVAFFKRNGL